MNFRIPLVVVFLLYVSATGFGQQAKLEGQVFDDQDKVVSGVRIIVPGGQAAITDSRGHFSISFPASVQPGKATRIEVAKPNWVIYEPMFGNCVTQSKHLNYEPLRVVIVPKSSPLALTPNRLSQVIAQWATERAKLRSEVGNLQQNLDEYAFLKQYANEYGFTLQRFRLAAERWARIKDSDDNEERSLKEYWRKRYAKSAQLAQESAQVALEELSQANEKRSEASLKVIRRYKLAGNAYFAQLMFREALGAYDEIAKRFETRELSRESLIAAWAETKSLTGNAKEALGIRVGGEEGPRLLREALADYQQAATVYSRDEFPEEWAKTQHNLGNVQTRLGEQVRGAESINYLFSALQAFRVALEVRTREKLPEDWATTQNGMGSVLTNLGQRVRGPESIQYLNDAVAAFRAALEVKTRERFPREWAKTQSNLGVAQLSLGLRLNGTQRLKYLRDAIIPFREALRVFTREELPQDWARTQHNLGGALSTLGNALRDAESVKYLNEAIVAYRSALQVFTREQLPQDWARTQNNLSAVLLPLGDRVSGPEQTKYWNEASIACRAALQVFTREQFPQMWATIQHNLGAALKNLGTRKSGTESTKYFNDAIVAYRSALEVRNREELPQDWTRTKSNLGTVYVALKDWPTAIETFVEVLAYSPNDIQAYSELTKLYHDGTFQFERAFVLNQKWVVNHPNDVAAQADFAEKHFTTQRFAECEQRIDALLTMPEVPLNSKIALRAIQIASLLGDGKASDVPGKINVLLSELNQQPSGFKVTWSFAGARHFIDENQRLLPYRSWLGQLFDALAREDRNEIVMALQKVQVQFHF